MREHLLQTLIGMYIRETACLVWTRTQSRNSAYLVAVVNCDNELLKQPASFTLHESSVIRRIMPLNVVNQITSGCILTNNAQMLRSKEHLMQLDDVGVHAT